MPGLAVLIPPPSFIQIGVREARQLTQHGQILEGAKVRLRNKAASVIGKSGSASRVLPRAPVPSPQPPLFVFRHRHEITALGSAALSQMLQVFAFPESRNGSLAPSGPALPHSPAWDPWARLEDFWTAFPEDPRDQGVLEPHVTVRTILAHPCCCRRMPQASVG